jgi:hypothetical protein
VQERLPKLCEEVLISEGKHLAVSWRFETTDGGWQWYWPEWGQFADAEMTTHWMPLPTPPSKGCDHGL